MGKKAAIRPQKYKDIAADLSSGNLNQKQIAIKHTVSESVISKIKTKEEQKEMASSLQVEPSNLKRTRPEKILGLSELLFSWFLKARALNVPLSYNILKTKAKEIAQGLGDKEFKASNGFLDKWLKRNDIKLKKICGEAKNFDRTSVENWQTTTLPHILDCYSLDDIYEGEFENDYYKGRGKYTYANGVYMKENLNAI